MAKTPGRTGLLKIGGTAVAGIRELTVNGAATPIDSTTAEDSGIQTFLDDVFSEETLEISVSGLEADAVLRDMWFGTAADKHISDMTLELPGALTDTVAANFIMTAFELGLPYQDATTFSATFVRSGATTYTQGA